MSERVRVLVEEGIGWVVLDRPEKHNAIDEALLRGVAGAVEAHAADDAVRVVIARGEGPSFSSGIDFSWLAGGRDPADKEGVKLRRTIRWIQGVMDGIERCEKPTIAMIHGFCGGLGLELALAFDFRVAARGASLGLPEVFFGLIPDCGGTTRLTRVAGLARAKELILTGAMIPAERAERFNVVNEVVPADQLEARCRALAARLMERSPAALGLAKQLIDLGENLDRGTFLALEALTQSILITSPDIGQHVMKGMADLKK